MSSIPAIAVAAAGLGLVAATWLHYLWQLRGDRAPARPLADLGAMTAGSGLAVAAMVMGGSALGPMILSAAATSLAFLFLFLLARRAIS